MENTTIRHFCAIHYHESSRCLDQMLLGEQRGFGSSVSWRSRPCNLYELLGWNDGPIHEARKPNIPLQQRQNKIIWRGKIHGWPRREQSRVKLSEMGKDPANTDWLNATETSYKGSNFVKPQEHALYRYQIDIGGVSGTTWGALRWKDVFGLAGVQSRIQCPGLVARVSPTMGALRSRQGRSLGSARKVSLGGNQRPGREDHCSSRRGHLLEDQSARLCS